MRSIFFQHIFPIYNFRIHAKTLTLKGFRGRFQSAQFDRARFYSTFFAVVHNGISNLKLFVLFSSEEFLSRSSRRGQIVHCLREAIIDEKGTRRKLSASRGRQFNGPFCIISHVYNNKKMASRATIIRGTIKYEIHSGFVASAARHFLSPHSPEIYSLFGGCGFYIYFNFRAYRYCGESARAPVLM